MKVIPRENSISLHPDSALENDILKRWFDTRNPKLINWHTTDVSDPWAMSQKLVGCITIEFVPKEEAKT